MDNTENTEYPKIGWSAWHCKCPRCRKGDLFAGPIFSFTSKKMYDNCSHCNLHFEKEPGYFYVAMFISYAFVVAELITACVGTYIITGNDSSPWLYMGVALAVTLSLSPFNYRYSRVVLLYWMTPAFKFKPTYFLRSMNNREKSLTKTA